MIRFQATFLGIVVALAASSQPVEFREVPVRVKSSFRALSVPDASVAWISGSRGWIGRSTDGGEHWNFFRIQGDSSADYRTLYAHDSLRAVVCNTGSPAVIRETVDGGRTWKEVYRNNHPDAFLDGIGFWDNNNGIIYGDPIDGRLLILRTTDGGNRWTAVSEGQRPVVTNGEASFAASGTTIRCSGKRSVWIATGGTRASVFNSNDRGKSWSRSDTPMTSGKPGAGIFSICLTTRGSIALAGGDYQSPQNRTGNYCIGKLPGTDWKIPNTTPGGYRSIVELIADDWLLTAGPDGADLSTDGGKSWKPVIAPSGLNVIATSRNGKLRLAGGRNGIWIIGTN
ncbi:MAG: oxidoreductase [Bacteroidota bacterium]